MNSNKLANIINTKIMNSSGTLAYGIELENSVNLKLFECFVTKSTTYNKKKGNPQPIIYKGKNFWLNCVGLRNPGIKEALSKITILKQKYSNIKIILSVAGSNIKEYLSIVDEAENNKYIIGYEINVSCPNTKKGLAFQNDINDLKKLLKLIIKNTNKLVFLKLSPNKNLFETIKKIDTIDINGYTLFNSYKVKGVNTKTDEQFLSQKYVGMSGKINFKKNLNLISKIRNLTSKEIIACGGVYSKKDASAYLKSGANFVQVGSANLENTKIIENLLTFFSSN